MTVLTDASIRGILVYDQKSWLQDDLVRKKKLLISPFAEDSLTPVGYDLRVGDRYLKMCTKLEGGINRLEGNEELIIEHNEVAAIETEEYVGMPQNRNYSGILVSKVSIAEMGLSHISTSLDPDYKGKMVITITNHSKRKVSLKRKQPFCTIIFFKNEQPAVKPCEKDPGEHISFLVENWKLPQSRIRIKRLYTFLNLFIPAIPLLYLLYRYVFASITEAEVGVFVAVSSMLFLILNSLLKTD